MKLARLRQFSSTCLLIATLCVLTSATAFGDELLRWNLGDTFLTLSSEGRSQLLNSDGVPIAGPVKAFKIGYVDGSAANPERVSLVDGQKDRFDVLFDDGARAKYKVKVVEGGAWIQLLELEPQGDPAEFFLFNIGVPSRLFPCGWINTVTTGDNIRIGVMTTSINAIPINLASTTIRGDKEDCDHSFKRLTTDPDDSLNADASIAEFTSTSYRSSNDGWAYSGKNFNRPLNLSGIKKIRARVYGDGAGEALKIQLGGKTGHRDDYVEVDFKGWKICELDAPPLNDITYDDVRSLYFYYNSLPSKKSVRCLIDWVDAVFDDGDKGERTIRLEDFTDPDSVFWDHDQTQVLTVKTYPRHKLAPASCALVATDSSNWAEAVQRLQEVAAVPSPRPGGGWRGESEWIHQNYFFLTYFNVDEYDSALAFAKRGGFKQILLLQNSWCESTGHYRVNEKNFPGGLPTLAETIKKFNNEGIRFGLHLLGASVDSNDPYLTPVPDKRFVTGFSTRLSAPLAAEKSETTIKTSDEGTNFPTGEDEYMGSGQFVRIDDEIIKYGRTERDGLYECQRGCYNTVVSAHDKGAKVRHFIRAYGYHLPDLDTDFIDEIAGNFAEVANALPIDMIYFDGSELLQRPGEGGEHWYYNARLHKAYYDKLKNKNILFQASSCSPYSWHMISRNASADGHDDLKAYLEERSGGFSYHRPENSFLDVGWYYAYDKNATPDMYEYCLGATIAYDASFSFQTSVSAASTHPFIGEILDMIRTYEELRRSGRIPEDLRKRFELDKKLAGRKTVEERNALLNLRKEFHLETDSNGAQVFRRVVYPSWQNVCSGSFDLGGTTLNDAVRKDDGYEWDFNVDQACRVGLQTHFTLLGDDPGDAKLVNPRVVIFRVDGEDKKKIGEIAFPCELSRGQYAFALPDANAKIYGRPLSEPLVSNYATPEIRLEPGAYRARFSVDSGDELQVRARLPLYCDETYAIPSGK